MWMEKGGMGILFFFHSAWGQCAIAFWRAIILLGSTSHCHLSPLRDISLHLSSCPEGVLRGGPSGLYSTSCTSHECGFS